MDERQALEGARRWWGHFGAVRIEDEGTPDQEYRVGVDQVYRQSGPGETPPAFVVGRDGVRSARFRHPGGDRDPETTYSGTVSG